MSSCIIGNNSACWLEHTGHVGMAFSPLISRLVAFQATLSLTASALPCYLSPAAMATLKQETGEPGAAQTLNPSRLLPSCHRDDKIQESSPVG